MKRYIVQGLPFVDRAGRRYEPGDVIELGDEEKPGRLWKPAPASESSAPPAAPVTKPADDKGGKPKRPSDQAPTNN